MQGALPLRPAWRRASPRRSSVQMHYGFIKSKWTGGGACAESAFWGRVKCAARAAAGRDRQNVARATTEEWASPGHSGTPLATPMRLAYARGTAADMRRCRE